MAFDMYLELAGIAGESVDSTHKDKIDVLAWSWNMSQSGTMHTGGGGGAGRSDFGDLSVTKYVDKSTPILMQMCATGDHIDMGKLYVRKAGKKPLEYLIIELDKILVTSVSTGGSGGEDRLTENISLNFRTYKVSYQPQSLTGGAEGGAIEHSYNIAEHAEP